MAGKWRHAYALGVRPTGKLGSAANPVELVGLQGGKLAAGWKAIKAQRSLEARMQAVLQGGAASAAKPKGRR